MYKRILDEPRCNSCIHNEACAAWVRHVETIYNDIVYSVENCPYFVEEKYGRWERVIPSKSAAKWSTKVSCSICHKAGYAHHKYCPNCGTKMEEEDGLAR